ncbi:MAG: hypothetical protein J5I93_15740 [Pirellulaceae bacterium]|nr:hypothetical protein [Pirellulaceae bacterium]
MDGQQYATSVDYYHQAQSIAAAVPQYTEQQAADMEWLPLGVWAVTRKDGTDSNMVLQLAVNKDGIVAGTYYNETTKTTIDLEGSVDKETQRVAWHPVDGKNDHIVFETGLFNLTEDSTTALVHFGADRTQEIVLVRLDQPKDQPAAEAQGRPGEF